LLDNNGFVLLSERTEHTGKFFGQIDGTIMDSLVQDRIFRRVGLMDYQGICSDRDNPYNAASERISSPIQPASWLLKYVFTFITTWLSFFTTPIIAYPKPYNYEDDEIPPYEEDYEHTDYVPADFDDNDFHITQPEIEKIPPPQTLPPRIVTPQIVSGPRVVPDPAHARPCDLKTDLYLLQPDRLNQSGQSNPLKV
jgi:hypothetical protein